jgi:hypothetical protein
MAKSKFWIVDPSTNKGESLNLGGAGHIQVWYDPLASKEVENRYRYRYFNVKSNRNYSTTAHAKKAALASAISRMTRALEYCKQALEEFDDLPEE